MPSGPPPKPRKLKLLAGNAGRRPLKAEPTLSEADATPPEELTGRALALWQERGPDLVRAGMATMDRAHAARACRVEALGLDLLGKASRGPVTKSQRGGSRVGAHLMAALKCFESADRVWFRFGITPSERSRLAVTPPEDTNAKKARDFFGD